MTDSNFNTQAINNFCDIITRTNYISNRHIGQLLLMIGILTDNEDRIIYAFENYPEDSDPTKPVDQYVLNILVQLQLLSPQDLIEIDTNNNNNNISSINNNTP